MKTVIFVESPTKAKTLTKFLGKDYKIEASFGHIRDLPKSRIGVDIEKDFTPDYIIPKDKLKKVKELKAVAKGADRIILATDPDREGEAIAFHLKEILKDINKKSEFKRIVFHEITKNAIMEAMERTREIDDDLVFAQTARRVLDRVVGYKLSPLLWKKVKRNLSAGRVQSVTLRLIVEREREIEKFEETTFYRLILVLNKQNDDTDIIFNLVKKNGGSVEESKKLDLYDGSYTYKITNLTKEELEIIVKDIATKDFPISNIEQKESKRSPYPPFTTSKLQQAAFRRFSYTGKRTMSLAQKLYENGYITYHRTDSFNLSNEFVTSARNYLEKTYGKQYVPENPKFYKTKSKVAQEAHEAIRPTDPSRDSSQISTELGADYAKVYDLIRRRALASQMTDAVYALTKIQIEIKAHNSDLLFEANGRILKFDGFLKVYSIKEENEQILPNVTVGEVLKYKNADISEHISNPPPRYNEASLISSLEKHGIGRPSTYAPTISTLYDRFYVEKEEGRLLPTKIGISVNDFLVKNFSNIDDIPFTAGLEDKLDEIANGKLSWIPMMKDFYAPFEKELEKAEGAERVKVEAEYVGKECPKDKGRLVIKQSRFGKFLACENFPECDYKESYSEETNLTCPDDGGKVIVRKTRKGRIFYGCANYPNCKFAAWKKEDVIKANEANEQKR